MLPFLVSSCMERAFVSQDAPEQMPPSIAWNAYQPDALPYAHREFHVWVVM